jgi:sulfite dehydrogenase (cytochrome) subunit A
LVVPGYYGTYWMKHLSKISVLDSHFEGFWMKQAYRVPNNDCRCVAPGTVPASTTPIGRYNVRSFITSLKEGQKVKAGRVEVKGIAFDGGSGIKGVAVSPDDGRTWRGAALAEDLGKYSFRGWSAALDLPAGGHDLKVRATNNAGDTQPESALWNPSGYMRNDVESVRIQAA